MATHRDRESDAARAANTARRCAVGRRGRLRSSIALDGLPGPPFGSLLLSCPLRPIPTTSDGGSEP